MYRSLFFILLLLALSYQSTVFAKPHIETAPDTPPPTDRAQKFTLTGYGEIHYNNINNTSDTLDFHRFVIGFNYDFTDKIHLRSEVEFEHGFAEKYIEYAYLDFDIVRWFNVRVGSILLPIGYLNVYHEPPMFYSVERPDIYSRIIPTTWMEGGLGFWGSLADGLTYQIYGHSSLNFNDGYDADSGFSGSSGIRGGRGKVADGEMNDVAGSFRLQYTGVKGLRVGTSTFLGLTDHGDPRVSSGLVALVEGDAKYSFAGLEFEGLLAVIFNPDAGEMTTAQRADGNIGATDVIGKQMLGYMVEGAYHLFHHLWRKAPVDLVTFVRYEKFDTHSQVPGGFARNAAYNRQNVTFGVAFYPIDQVVLKADYSWKDNGTNTANSQFNLGAGYYF